MRLDISLVSTHSGNIDFMASEQHPSNRFNEIARNAQEVTLRDGYHLPTIIAESADNSIIVQIEGIGATHEERLYQLFVVGLKVAESGEISVLQQAFFIMEAWLSLLRRGNIPQQLPSEDPQRKEALVVSGVQIADHRMDVIVFEMVRDGRGHLTDLQEMHPHHPVVEADNPMLIAFVRGFATGLGAKLN